MVLLIIFLVSLVLSVLLVRRVYRQQLRLKPEGKLMARCVAGFVGVAFFFVVNAFAISFHVADSGDEVATPVASAESAVERVAATKFVSLYNKKITLLGLTSTEVNHIKIKDKNSDGDMVYFDISSLISGVGQSDDKGQLKSLIWSVASDGSPESGVLGLTSMAAVIDEVDPSIDYKEAMHKLSQILNVMADNRLNESFKTEDANYTLTKSAQTPFMLNIELVQ